MAIGIYCFTIYSLFTWRFGLLASIFMALDICAMFLYSQ